MNTGAAPQETPRDDSSSQPPEVAPPLPAPERPPGLILHLEGKIQSTWVSPESIRPLSNFGTWHRAMIAPPPEDRQFAALDAIVLMMDTKAVIKPGGAFHLEIPGDPPRYLKFQIEAKDTSAEATAKVTKDGDEFFCLLLRLTTLTAHPVLIKEREVPASERMRGKFI